MPKTPKESLRLQAARFIFDREKRLDSDGHLRVYGLEAADGGGDFEVAGINDGYHHAEAHHLRQLVHDKEFFAAETYAIAVIARYTDVVTKWTRVPALEVFLRDCCFNRGPKGALRILQIALMVADDGKCGPITLGALRSAEPHVELLLRDLRRARESYERRIAPPVGKRAKYWTGLVNRWDAAAEFARQFIA